MVFIFENDSKEGNLQRLKSVKIVIYCLALIKKIIKSYRLIKY